jgi:hypothetical protein
MSAFRILNCLAKLWVLQSPDCLLPLANSAPIVGGICMLIFLFLPLLSCILAHADIYTCNSCVLKLSIAINNSVYRFEKKTCTVVVDNAKRRTLEKLASVRLTDIADELYKYHCIFSRYSTLILKRWLHISPHVIG